MVVAAVVVSVSVPWRVDGAAEFAAPDHQRVVQHAALLQILDQRRRGLVGLLALLRDVCAAGCCADPSRDGRAG